MHAYHEDSALFREAVSFTVAETGFSARLIEKDYFCSLLLSHLMQNENHPLVFKGGTCLAKIHAGFYRLSEDLDFMISVSSQASRRERRDRMIEVKSWYADLPKHLPCFLEREPLMGRNESRQYLGLLGYSSVLSDQTDTIKFEVSLREPLLLPTVAGNARTLLINPISESAMVPAISVRSIALQEALAEKLRAALARPEPVIRDLYDLDYVSRHLDFRWDDTELIQLLNEKLAIPGNKIVKPGPELLQRLRAQMEARLKPVLRSQDYKAFDLEGCFGRLVSLLEVL